MYNEVIQYDIPLPSLKKVTLHDTVSIVLYIFYDLYDYCIIYTAREQPFIYFKTICFHVQYFVAVLVMNTVTSAFLYL